MTRQEAIKILEDMKINLRAIINSDICPDISKLRLEQAKSLIIDTKIKIAIDKA